MFFESSTTKRFIQNFKIVRLQRPHRISKLKMKFTNKHKNRSIKLKLMGLFFLLFKNEPNLYIIQSFRFSSDSVAIKIFGCDHTLNSFQYLINPFFAFKVKIKTKPPMISESAISLNIPFILCDAFLFYTKKASTTRSLRHFPPYFYNFLSHFSLLIITTAFEPSIFTISRVCLPKNVQND